MNALDITLSRKSDDTNFMLLNRNKKDGARAILKRNLIVKLAPGVLLKTFDGKARAAMGCYFYQGAIYLEEEDVKACGHE